MTLRTLLVSALLTAAASATLAQEAPSMSFPAPTSENKLWTRWWWMGNAVDKENLTTQLEAFAKTGLGGVEICPIYGVNGAESREVKFLSPDWMNLLVHTTREAQRLGMNVDLTSGTGWPFGGPMVTKEEASSALNLRVYDSFPKDSELPKGQLLLKQILPPNGGAPTDITHMVDVTSPTGAKFLVATVQNAIQKVKRAAPGGEGNVLDPYSPDAMTHYLDAFDKAFEGFQDDLPTGYFHDSFEYYGATYTPKLFDEFQKRRGYDLRQHLAALAGTGDKDAVARVRHDYRETLSDLHQTYMDTWTAWTHTHGGKSRNQAHGAPANILDIYAGADTPETEVFHLYDESHLPFLKFASSAAHVTGKKLASSESFTWLDEHFNVTLAEVKRQTDFLFLTGTNHIFLHGIPYSPKDAIWPGWNFYASVNFGPNGGLWHNMPEFAAYVARCQSILQANKPANDILLYMPFHQFWTECTGGRRGGEGAGSMMFQFTTPGEWMKPFPVYTLATTLWDKGFSYDSISDKLLAKTSVNADGTISAGGNPYKTLILPNTSVIPVDTLQKIVDLATAGATVIVQDALPTDVPGLNDLDNRRAALKKLSTFAFIQDQSGVAYAKVGKGTIYMGKDIPGLLQTASVRPETMVGEGLRFIRRARPDGLDYFIVNRSDKAIDAVPLNAVNAAAPKSIVIMDPLFESRAGIASVTETPTTHTVNLHLEPGRAFILRTYDHPVEGPAWINPTPAGPATPLTGTWSITFTEGGPALPKPLTTDKLLPWTKLGGDDAQAFAGTAKYTLTFNKPVGGAGNAENYQLDLGTVLDAARVSLNGKPLGNLWSAPFTTLVPASDLKDGPNTLDVEITNVAANHIRYLDQHGIKWKIFKDINIVTTAYKPLDASTWPVRDAGLLGPVQLIPLKK